jgi:hypothetical protein
MARARLATTCRRTSEWFGLLVRRRSVPLRRSRAGTSGTQDRIDVIGPTSGSESLAITVPLLTRGDLEAERMVAVSN